MRKVVSTDEFFDLLDDIKGGAIITLGYVATAGLDVPTVKRKNPATNRPKSYPDYNVFEGGSDIGALVKVTSYNFNYRNRQSVHDYYFNVFKPGVNKLNQEFGIPEMGTKKSYKDVSNYTQNGQELYKGNNETKFGNAYNPQNMFKPLHISSSIYAIGTDGHILRELSKDEIKPYLKEKGSISGVNALRKLGAADDVVEDYLNRYNELKFSYKNFESKSILYIVATVNGEKIIYINDNLMRTVDDININPQDFIAIAKAKYQKDLAESTLRYKKMIRESRQRKSVVRLTESDLKNIIKESVKRVLREASGYVPNDGNGRVGGSWGSRTLNATISVFSEIENAIYEKQKGEPDYENVLDYLYKNEDVFTIPVDYEESYDYSVGNEGDYSIEGADEDAIDNARKVLEDMPTSNPKLKQIALDAFEEGVDNIFNDRSIYDRLDIDYPDYD